MAIKKISEFTSGTPTASDKILFEQNGTGKSTNFADIPIPTKVQTALDDLQNKTNIIDVVLDGISYRRANKKIYISTSAWAHVPLQIPSPILQDGERVFSAYFLALTDGFNIVTAEVKESGLITFSNSATANILLNAVFLIK